MEDEADLATASLEQARFWRKIYVEILTMEEAVLERIRQLMVGQSPQARREVELTNVPVVVAQAERFRSRLAFWESRVQALAVAPRGRNPEAASVACRSRAVEGPRARQEMYPIGLTTIAAYLEANNYNTAA